LLRTIEYLMYQGVLLIGIIFLAALVNSTFGFGFALVSMSVLSLFFDLALIGPLIPLFLLTNNVLIVWRSWENIRFKSIVFLIMSAGVAIPIGVWLSVYGDEGVIKTLLGSFLIFFALFNLVVSQLPHLRQRWAPVFGFISGFFGGAYNIAGPPIAIYGLFRQWAPKVFRATIPAYYTFVTVIIILNHWYFDHYDDYRIAWYYCLGMPMSFVAVPMGKWLNGQFRNPVAFQQYIYYIMIILGGVMILKAQQIV